MSKRQSRLTRLGKLVRYLCLILVITLLAQAGPVWLTGAGTARAAGSTQVYFPLTTKGTTAQGGITAGNKLKASVASQVDQKVAEYNSYCSGISVGLVYGTNVVYAKDYGSHTSGQTHEWASVSKPLTALALMRLWERGLVNLGSPIWQYAPQYYSIIPSAYRSNPLTLQYLLTHTGGVNHLGNEGTSAMFIAAPGSTYSYSTNGFGIVGDVMKGVLNTDYATIVKSEIGSRVGAPSLTAYNDFIAPGAFVKSNITDFARFAAGVTRNSFVSSDTLYNKMLVNYVSGASQGLGFQVSGSGTSITAYHSGDNGTPKARLYIKPKLQRAVTIFCTSSYSWSSTSVLANLSFSLDSILGSNGNPCANPSDCIAASAASTKLSAPQDSGISPEAIPADTAER